MQHSTTFDAQKVVGRVSLLGSWFVCHWQREILMSSVRLRIQKERRYNVTRGLTKIVQKLHISCTRLQRVVSDCTYDVTKTQGCTMQMSSRVAHSF